VSDIEALADVAHIENAKDALALVEAFYPPERIPAKVRFGVEEIMERVVASAPLLAAAPAPGHPVHSPG
jgi:hypothetical protein